MNYKFQLPYFNKLLSAGFAALLLLSWSNSPGQGSWAQLSDMPVIKNHPATITYDDKIYIFGGGIDGNNCTAEVWEYDPETDTYTAKAPIPVDVCYPAVAEYNGKIYLFGGYQTYGALVTNEVYEYDVSDNSWEQKQSMSADRGLASACVLNDKIYVIGGVTSAVVGLSRVDIYDPVADTWSEAPAMPIGRGSAVSYVVNGKIYVLGGASGNYAPPIADIAVFDPEGSGWTLTSPMPTPRIVFGGGEVGGKIFVMGGYVHYPVFMMLSSVQMYDPSADQWTTTIAPMPITLRGFSASVWGGKIYVFGGNNTFNGFFRSVYVFDPGNLVPVVERTTPKGVTLAQNAPNPFNEETDIAFTISQSGYVDLSLLDINGHVLQTLISQNLTPGTYNFRLDAHNLEAGIYIYRLRLDDGTPEVRKMVVVK